MAASKSGGPKPWIVSATASLKETLQTQAQEESDLDKLEAKADKQEKKLDKLEAKLDKLEAKADKQEKKLDKIEGKLDKQEAKLDKIEKKTDSKTDKSSIRFPPVATIPDIQEFSGLLATPALRRFKPLAARRLNQLEAELDRNEESLDRHERARDQQEELLDRNERRFDDWEKNLDLAEADFDKAEKLLDEEPKKASKPEQLPFIPSPEDGVIAGWIGDLRQQGSRAGSAARKIERAGPAATLELLKAYDESSAEHFRWEIVNLLGYTRDARAVPLLAERGIQDHELHPRWRSIWALTSVDDGTAASRLKETIATSTGLRRRNAAVALSLFGDRAAIAELRQGLRSKSPWIRWESASCLAGYSDPRTASQVLKRYSREPDQSVRQEMVKAVLGVATQPVLRFLKQRLADPDKAIRSIAADTMLRTVGRAFLPADALSSASTLFT